NREVGTHFKRAVWRVGAHARDAAIFLDQIDRLRPHAQMERRIALAVVGEEVEEVPLRHQRNELAAGRQVGEICKGIFVAAEIRADGGRFLVRKLENSSSRPSSPITSRVEGWMVSPRKSRRKSPCFSSTTTSTPARASRKPSMSPHGPPPTMQEGVECLSAAIASLSATSTTWVAHAFRTAPTPEGKIPTIRSLTI